MIPEVDELEKLREELGFSQTEIAGQLQIHWRTYQEWVYKDAKPSYDNLKEIEKWLEKNREKVR